MPDSLYLFVSYASVDRDRVLPIVERLEAAGVRVWIDREGMSGGANYALEIAEAIEGAVAFVLMCSPASLASRNVKQEIALAWRFEKPYLPLLLEPVEIPKDVAYWLEAAQWVEVLDRPAERWLADVAQALRRWDFTLQPERAMPLPTTTRERPLLVGREREQAWLRAQLDRVLAGRGAMVLVGGEAGIGKTTLAEDLSIQAEEQGALVLWGHAYHLSVTPPYGPWAEILRRYPSMADALLPPVPAFVGDAEELAKVGSQETLFAAVAEFFATVATQRPLVLVLDDLHWVDKASLDFFRYLSRQVANHCILLAATYRSDELHRRHPLYSLLPTLVREAGAERLDVRPLDENGHRALLQERYSLPGHDQERLEQYVSEYAEGNPLYVGELLRTLEEEGVLTRRDGQWLLGDVEQLRLPPFLRQVIEGRLGHLERETRDLLQVGAVIGQEVPLDLWQHVTGADDEPLISALEQGRSAGLIEDAPVGNSWRFHHALIREALYEDLVSLRRRALHRQVAEQLEKLPAPDPDSVAYHFQQANDSRAADWLIAAGWRADLGFALSAARDRYDAAQEILALEAERTGLRGWLLYQLARAGRFSEHDHALVYLDEADRIARMVGNRSLEVAVLAERGFIHSLVTGSFDIALTELTEALASYDAIPPERWTNETEEIERLRYAGRSLVQRITPRLWDIRAWMEARRAVIIILLAEIGDFARALALWNEWMPRWSDPSAIAGWGNGRIGWQYAEWALGRPDRGLREHAAAVQLMVDHQNYLNAASEIEQQLFWRHSQYDTDNLTARASMVRDMVGYYQRAAEYGNASLAESDGSLHRISFIECNWDASAGSAEAVLRQPQGQETWHIQARCTLAAIAGHRGQYDRAQAEIATVLTDGPATDPGRTLFLESQMLQRLAAEFAFEAQDLPVARVWLEAHDRWLEWSGAVLGRAEGAWLWARYHHASNDHEQARQFAGQALVLATDPRQPLALIAIHRFLGMLDTEEQHFDPAEEHLQESQRLAEACQAPFERALTLLEIAELRSAQRRPQEAKALLDEVQAICEPLGAAPTLARVEALRQQLADVTQAVPSYPAGLSEREVEVLRLVAEGLTDAEVAERLFLSPRTIGSHLRSIYNKIGVGSRAAAARFAEKHHLV